MDNATTKPRVETYLTKFTNQDVLDQVRQYPVESRDAVYDFILWAGEKYNLNDCFGLVVEKLEG